MFRQFFLVTLVMALCSGCGQSDDPPAEGKTIRVASLDDPQSLDPRLVRDLATVTTLHMLYDGLYRANEEGNPEPALAAEMEMSADRKTYTFHLKESLWSDGSPLTAEDFVYSWHSVLDPKFPAPNAYQLYVIKGAEAAKDGDLPLEEVGITATDSRTLVVELEAPIPYFLDLLATHFFFPINQNWDQLPDDQKMDQLVTNGPFSLVEWKRQHELKVKRNPHYWDHSSVEIDEVVVMNVDENTAMQMYHGGEVDWIGSPLSTIPADALESMKQENTLEMKPAAGVHWFRVNTDQEPFTNAKIRKAFALALDRQGLVEYVLQGNQIPATGIVPPLYGMNRNSFFTDNDSGRAQTLFDQGLAELKTSIDKLPAIKISYAHNERNHKLAQAVQQQWKTTLGVEIELDNTEGNVFFEKLKSGQYQIASGSWFADINDPINFLNVFRSKKNSTNNTNWENPQFSMLLNRSRFAITPERRKVLLNDAEAVLMGDMPVIPLFYSTFNYQKRDTIKNVYFSELGYLDFKRANILQSRLNG